MTSIFMRMSNAPFLMRDDHCVRTCPNGRHQYILRQCRHTRPKRVTTSILAMSMHPLPGDDQYLLSSLCAPAKGVNQCYPACTSFATHTAQSLSLRICTKGQCAALHVSVYAPMER